MPHTTVTQPELTPPREVSWLDTEVLGNTVLAWLIALGLAAAVFVAGLLLRRLIVGYATRAAATRRAGIADLLIQLARRLSMSVVFAVALTAGTYVLVLPGTADRVIRLLVVAAVAWQALRFGHALVDFGLGVFERSRLAADGTPDPSVSTSMGVLRVLVLMALYTLVILVAADNLGIEVTSLIAGLGIGGIAVALAVQNILGDLFSSLSIVLDKPFVVGDFIIAGDKMGTVERIGIKTTRVRALSGEQLVFANSDLLSSRIQNFKRMQERRVVFSLGVVYQTPPEVLDRLPGVIREAVEAQQNVRFDRAHFKAFGPSSLDFEAVYYLLTSEFNPYMDVQQAINLRLMRDFAELGVEFAYPTQTLFLQRGGQQQPPRPPQ